MTRVVLITDDLANKEKAEKEGILAATAEEYIKSLVDYPMLIDKYARKDIEKDRETDPLFPMHLSMNEIIEGVRNQRLLQGAFQASRENYLEGSVNVEGYENPVSEIASHLSAYDINFCSFLRFSFKAVIH